MAINIPRGGSDPILERIVEVLESYQTDHPGAQIDLYRHNSVSVHVRVIDPDFTGRNRVERSKLVWQYLDKLGDETQSDISMLLLLVPDETKLSFANFEFDDPIPSSL